ncbi:MAG: catechol-2,3-dioxygenase [Rhodothermales bacterium]
MFGVEEVNHIDAEDGRYAIRILTGGGLRVELIRARGTERPSDRHLGLFKTGLFVSDIEAFHAVLEERTVDVDAQIFVDEALNARSFVFRDLEGNRIQAFQLLPR